LQFTTARPFDVAEAHRAAIASLAGR
jgi:hypothetical protein